MIQTRILLNSLTPFHIQPFMSLKISCQHLLPPPFHLRHFCYSRFPALFTLGLLIFVAFRRRPLNPAQRQSVLRTQPVNISRHTKIYTPVNPNLQILDFGDFCELLDLENILIGKSSGLD